MDRHVKIIYWLIPIKSYIADYFKYFNYDFNLIGD